MFKLLLSIILLLVIAQILGITPYVLLAITIDLVVKGSPYMFFVAAITSGVALLHYFRHFLFIENLSKNDDKE